MGICNSYALFYDLRQMIKKGELYFFDLWNIIDWLYIITGYINLMIQYDIYKGHNQQDIDCKLVNIIFVLFMFIKSFFFLRMHEKFTKIVIMITNVMKDLREFVVFYVFIMAMLS